MTPVAVLAVAVAFFVTWLVFRPALAATAAPDDGGEGLPKDRPRHPKHTRLLVKSLLVTVVTVGCFFAGLPMAVVAAFDFGARQGWCLAALPEAAVNKAWSKASRAWNEDVEALFE